MVSLMVDPFERFVDNVSIAWNKVLWFGRRLRLNMSTRQTCIYMPRQLIARLPSAVL